MFSSALLMISNRMILLALIAIIKHLYIFERLQILFAFEIFTRASVIPKSKQANNSTTHRLKVHLSINPRE